MTHLELLKASLGRLDPLSELDLVVRQDLEEVQELDTVRKLGAQVANVHLALAKVLIAARN